MQGFALPPRERIPNKLCWMFHDTDETLDIILNMDLYTKGPGITTNSPTITHNLSKPSEATHKVRNKFGIWSLRL